MKEKTSTLQRLKSRDDITKANKEFKGVVLDKQAYVAKANRQLQLTDKHFYKELDADPTEEFSARIANTLDEMYENDEISVNIYETLCQTNCRLGQFYLVPQIHKEGMPAWTPYS